MSFEDRGPNSTKLNDLGYVVVANAPGASPQSLEKTGNLKGSALDQVTETPKRGNGGGTSSRRMAAAVGELSARVPISRLRLQSLRQVCPPNWGFETPVLAQQIVQKLFHFFTLGK